MVDPARMGYLRERATVARAVAAELRRQSRELIEASRSLRHGRTVDDTGTAPSDGPAGNG
ncbi:hypothetical protein [Streptomyces sp. SGAir0957]